MAQPRDFCSVIMHEYERQWGRASGHSVRHPLRLKMERLNEWCGEEVDADAFERRLETAQKADDPGTALLATELLPLWRLARKGQPLPFPESID